MNRFGRILFLSVSLVGLDAAVLMAMEAVMPYVSVMAQQSSLRPTVPPASQAVAPVRSSSRFIPQRPVCALCLAAWGVHKRQGCDHSFCNGCYESSRAGECPTCTEEANQCAICFELFDNSVKMLLCGHMFCAGCITNWQAQCVANRQGQRAGEDYRETCPACRAPLIFKETVHCEICRHPFKNSDEITPPLVCKLITWSNYYKKFFCRQQFAHRFHDRCFNQHYLQQGQHMTDSREHTATCPIHKKTVPGPQYSGGCSSYYEPTGYITLPHILPERGGPQEYIEYIPGQVPNNDPPSPRTANHTKKVVADRERMKRLRVAPMPDQCTIS